MAEQAWRIFSKAKNYLMNGTLDLDTDTFNLTLHTSAAALTTASLAALTSFASVAASEVTSTSGYSTSGTALQSVTWQSGASAGEQRFDCADVVVTALGSDIANIKFAVISDAGDGKLLAYSRLSTSQYTVTAGNTHTITIASGGIFELN